MSDELSGWYLNLMELARQEAIRLGHPYIGTEHQLLGLLRARDAALSELIELAGISLDHVRDVMEAAIRSGKDSTIDPGRTLPYTSRARKVLGFAMAEANADGSVTSDGRSLVRAFYREDQNMAAEVLRSVGIASA